MQKMFPIYLLLVALALLGIQSCATYYFRSNYKDLNSLVHATKTLTTIPFLKAHLKNGDVYILKDNWRVDTSLNMLLGNGVKYNFNREYVSEGTIALQIDSIAILETNSKLLDPESQRIKALSILAGLDAIVGLICLTNPKACFGSCPTFYINGNDNFHFADGEGFSSAISPSMEYHDIDALNSKFCSDTFFNITMKNEALETHCVNDVHLLVYPINSTERVYQSPNDEFFLCENNYPLSYAEGYEGEITSLLKNEDRHERFSFSDESNLNSKEEIILTFDQVQNYKDLGLILNYRQTLMPTYLFYSALGYMGDQVSDVFSILETNKEMRHKFDTLTKILGPIDIYLWDPKTNHWVFQNSVYETGPIAFNKHFVPLKNTTSVSSIKIKLALNKGLWRIDHVALSNIKNVVNPIEIQPQYILNKGILDPLALTEINIPDKYLVSMPGSEYSFNFVLPSQNTNYELFLYSKGYYLEWMREQWIKDKNLLKLKQMVNNPLNYLRHEARAYKQYENLMEQAFWNSKVDTKRFSYYEN